MIIICLVSVMRTLISFMIMYFDRKLFIVSPPMKTIGKKALFGKLTPNTIDYGRNFKFRYRPFVIQFI